MQWVFNRVAIALVALAAVGCVDRLDAGEFGTLRYFGEVRGEQPVRLLPPITDREGNTYVMYGDRELAEVQTWVGFAGGGWQSACQLHEGDHLGAHGWLGAADDRAWYWSGEAMVEVSGATGHCQQVAPRDPATNSTLQVLGAAPWIHQSPTRTTAVALVSSRDRDGAFVSVFDLDSRKPSHFLPFAPATATDVEVLATGGARDAKVAVFALRYRDGGRQHAELRWYDQDGAQLARSEAPALLEESASETAGWLQVDSRAHVAALLGDGGLLSATGEGTTVFAAPPGFAPVGVHRWDDVLWLVGVSDGGPALARLASDGSIGEVGPWAASLRAATSLSGAMQVLDDRSEPRLWLSWEEAKTAMGAWPFVTPHAPLPAAAGTTAWLVAGPSYDVSFEAHTQVAAGPVGISYP